MIKILIITFLQVFICQIYAQKNATMKKEEIRKICDEIVGCAKNYNDMLEIIKRSKYPEKVSEQISEMTTYNSYSVEEVGHKWDSFVVFNYYGFTEYSHDKEVFSIAMDYNGNAYLLNGLSLNEFDKLVETWIKQIKTKEDAIDVAKLYIYTVKNYGVRELFIDSSNISRYNALFGQQLNPFICEEKEDKYFIQIWSMYAGSCRARRHKIEMSRNCKILKYESDSWLPTKKDPVDDLPYQ